MSDCASCHSHLNVYGLECAVVAAVLVAPRVAQPDIVALIHEAERQKVL